MRCERRGEAVQQKSVHGDSYYVCTSRVLCNAGEHDGFAVELRNCARAKTRRICLVLVCLGALYLAISFLLVNYKAVVQCIFTSILCLYFIFSALLSTYKEVVLIVRGLGVQISSTNWLGYTSSVFLPHTIVSDIIINEGITMCRIVFYLAVMVVRDKTKPHPQVVKLYPLFTDFNPRLSAIEEVYHLLRYCLTPVTDNTSTTTDRAEWTKRQK